MAELTSAALNIIRQYAALLETIEEGLDYVEASFSDPQRMHADVLLSDVLLALGKIGETNVYLEQLFAEENDFVRHLERFVDVLDAAAALDGQFSDAAAKERIVCGRLSPAFQAWKAAVSGRLRRYVVQ
ncbi:hypothetical protein GS3922_00690 [Geobacillus subterraneus]|uniref:DUF8042 domain-containing protein n=2 Tax=Geobacillus TaxID=129337 RepID=A0ABM6A8B2_9BACL|nr:MULTISPECIES: hypothetical protein [Geobacillus]AMX82327.1 hypothetical protein GS3922_00690 [Geobacillus subterraneus]KZS24470.1 hypothetical protein A5418_00810 [Geobacillus subterraneus]OXB91359.1 hypothetical protein B9L21_00475 [Geobacillus uzenensis]QIZ65888.1 hypothetical protein HF500_00200 [Geobacillus subterraneus]